MSRWVFLFVWAGFVLHAVAVSAAGEDTEASTMYGAGFVAGGSYDPHGHIHFMQLNMSALFDYERVWPHRAPAPLRFKIEGNFGLADWPKGRALLSGNMFALYYVGHRTPSGFRPYIEGGIGLIYTDFQVKGQGLRINFNPQLGGGVDIESDDWGHWYASIRLHHVSNGGLYHDNRGVNSWGILIGRYF